MSAHDHRLDSGDGSTAGAGRPTDTDFRGARRLVGGEEWFWYLSAGTSYILLGIWHKWLLNWFIGPLWLIAFVVIGPGLTDRIGLTSRRDPPPPDVDGSTSP